MMSFDLARFVQAQDAGAFDDALAELGRGRKASHWIWFVFPQLRGLGSSWAAMKYGLEGVAEADAYLQHPTLRARLLRAAEVVRAQLRRGIRIEDLMGSEIDTLKLVSSMTLFEHVARSVASPSPGSDPSPQTAVGSDAPADIRALADVATDILATAAAQGYPRCQFTCRHLSR